MSINGLIKIENTDVCIIKHKDGYPSYIRAALQPLLEAIKKNGTGCGYYSLDSETLAGSVAKALSVHSYIQMKEATDMFPEDEHLKSIFTQGLFLSGHCITTLDKVDSKTIDHVYIVTLDGELKCGRIGKKKVSKS